MLHLGPDLVSRYTVYCKKGSCNFSTLYVTNQSSDLLIFRIKNLINCILVSYKTHSLCIAYRYYHPYPCICPLPAVLVCTNEATSSKFGISTSEQMQFSAQSLESPKTYYNTVYVLIEKKCPWYENQFKKCNLTTLTTNRICISICAKAGSLNHSQKFNFNLEISSLFLPFRLYSQYCNFILSVSI